MHSQALNQYDHQGGIRIPLSVVRSVSLDKLKNGQTLVGNPISIFLNQVDGVGNSKNIDKSSKENVNLVNKMLEKKLGMKSPMNIRGKQNQQKSIFQRYPHKINPQKIEEMRKEVEEKEMKQCTFKPQTNPGTGNSKRTSDLFFHDQLSFAKRTTDKIDQMRQFIQAEKQKQNIFHPTTAHNRSKASKQQVQKVYDRLYEPSRANSKDLLSRQSSQETIRTNSITKNKRFLGISRGNFVNKKENGDQLQTPHPMTQKSLKYQHHRPISMQSQQSRHQQSAKRGINVICSKQKRMNNFQRGTTSSTTGANQSIQKKESNRNQELYATKLMKEIITVIQKLNIPFAPSYLETSLFLQKLNFINAEASMNERKLLYEIWQMLQGDSFGHVSIISLCKLIFAIMGCHNVTMVCKLINKSEIFDVKNIEKHQKYQQFMDKGMSFNQNILVLNEKDSKAVKVMFQELYCNRMKCGESELTRPETVQPFSFKPSISKSSSELAEKYRQRVISESEKLMSQNKLAFNTPQNGYLNHIDLLLLDQKRRESLLQMKREEIEKERKKAEDQSMLGGKTDRQSARESKNTSRDRNKELFQIGKHNQLSKRDKSKDEVEQEKWKNQLTFKPNIHSKPTLIDSKDAYVPDFDKSIFRMLEAKKLRNQSLRPSVQKHNPLSSDPSPLLYLNVAMEGQECVRVPVFSTDNMKCIAEKVRIMMDLNGQEDGEKLQQVLRGQIVPVMRQMGLDSEAITNYHF